MFFHIITIVFFVKNGISVDKSNIINNCGKAPHTIIFVTEFLFGCKDKLLHPCCQRIMLRKPCENITLFPDHQLARQRYLLSFATLTFYTIMVCHCFASQIGKNFSDPGTLLVYRIQYSVQMKREIPIINQEPVKEGN